MRIQVCVPTYSKTDKDIINLYHFLNLSTDALFSVQKSDKDYIKEIEIDNHKVKIVYLTSTGVSKNRNSLLDNATGDIIINTDDDCPLVDHYDRLVLDTYNKHKDAVAIYFNGIWVTHDNKLVTNKRSKRITKFSDISFAGAPGLTYKRESFNKYNLRFKEDIGYPNYICAGEDSCFYYDIVKSKIIFYREKSILFKVIIDETNSSYYKGINEQYVVTRGYITRLLHPRLFRLYMWRHIIRFHRKDKSLSYRQLRDWMLEG